MMDGSAIANDTLDRAFKASLECPFDVELPTEEDVELTEEQELLLDAVTRGRSCFITGAAGTGKSFLLRRIMARLPRATTFVTAPTWNAAALVNGVTVHNFAKLCPHRPEEGRQPTLADHLRSAGQQRPQLCAAKVLMIDEVCHLGRDVFDTLDAVMREFRGCPAVCCCWGAAWLWGVMCPCKAARLCRPTGGGGVRAH